MTDKDKLEKVRAEIERVKKNQEGVFTSYTDGKFDLCEHLLDFIDSMQEEPKECMYSKDNYTDEDRKSLCDGCEEKCKYDKSDDFTKALAECIHNAQCNVIDPMVFAETWKDELIKLSKCEEPVSEDLEDAARDYAYEKGEIPKGLLFPSMVGNGKLVNKKEFNIEDVEDAVIYGAKWQKQHMMANAVDGFVIEDIEEGNGDFLLSAEYLSKDMGLKDRQKVKVIVIRED